MVVVGAIVLVVAGAAALTPMLIGLIAILCGAACIALDNLNARMQELSSRLSESEKAFRAQQPASEQIVDQLRAEGFIRSGSVATDQEIEDIIE